MLLIEVLLFIDCSKIRNDKSSIQCTDQNEQSLMILLYAYTINCAE